MIKSITDNIRNKLYKDKNPLLVLSRLDNIPINKREDYVRLIILDYLVFNFDEQIGHLRFSVSPFKIACFTLSMYWGVILS